MSHQVQSATTESEGKEISHLNDLEVTHLARKSTRRGERMISPPKDPLRDIEGFRKVVDTIQLADTNSPADMSRPGDQIHPLAVQVSRSLPHLLVRAQVEPSAKSQAWILCVIKRETSRFNQRILVYAARKVKSLKTL